MRHQQSEEQTTSMPIAKFLSKLLSFFSYHCTPIKNKKQKTKKEQNKNEAFSSTHITITGIHKHLFCLLTYIYMVCPCCRLMRMWQER